MLWLWDRVVEEAHFPFVYEYPRCFSPNPVNLSRICWLYVPYLTVQHLPAFFGDFCLCGNFFPLCLCDSVLIFYIRSYTLVLLYNFYYIGFVTFLLFALFAVVEHCAENGRLLPDNTIIKYRT